MKMRKLSKLLVAGFLIMSIMNPIHAASTSIDVAGGDKTKTSTVTACTTTTDYLELVEAKALGGLTIKPKTKHEDGLILQNDELDVIGSITVNLGNYLKCRGAGTTSTGSKQYFDVTTNLSFGTDSYIYNDKRDMRIDEIDTNITSSSVTVDFENRTRMKYLGTGSTVHVSGSITITPYAADFTETLDSTLVIPVDITYDVTEFGGGTAYTDLSKALLNPSYVLSVDKIKSETPFDISLEMVDPNIEFKYLSNNKFESSYVILTSTAFNAANKVGTISNLHANEQGYLAYTVTFKNVYYVSAGTLDFSINYDGRLNKNGIPYTFEQSKTASVSIFEIASGSSTSDDDTNIPKLLITNYSGINSIVAGNSASISVTFTNTSADKAMENIVFTVDGGDSFVIASGVNKFFVETLPAKGKYTLNVKLNCLKTTSAGSHDVTFNTTYTYEGAAAETSTTNSLTIPVTQVDRVRINTVKMNGVWQGSESEVTYSIVNQGLSGIRNANLTIYNGEEELGSAYLGAIAAGGEAKGTNIYITFQEMGEFNLTAVVTYEDDDFNEKEIREDFTVSVNGNSYEEIQPYIPDDTPIEPDTPKTNVLPIAIGVIVVAAIVAFVIFKKKKNKAVIDDEDL